MSRSPAHAHPSHWANSFGMHAPFFSILAKFSKPDFALWARIEKWGMHTREDRKWGMHTEWNDGNEQSGCSCASIPLGKFIRYACPIFEIWFCSVGHTREDRKMGHAYQYACPIFLFTRGHLDLIHSVCMPHFILEKYYSPYLLSGMDANSRLYRDQTPFYSPKDR